ncbi:hypothetical protein RB195_015562 [Necator americanus]|uniref:Tubulin-specific chaperone A n=1 Tax=Necator americanus TaxID=51031 RepID=A0ABR1E6D3_NECAM
MATSLKTSKKVLTRHSNSLTQLLTKHAALESNVNLQDREACNAALKQVQNATVDIKPLQATFEEALYAFTDAVDKISEPLTKEEEDKMSEYIISAEELIASTTDLLRKLEITRGSLTSHNPTSPTRIGSSFTRSTCRQDRTAKDTNTGVQRQKLAMG